MSSNDAVASALWWQRGTAADPQDINRYSYGLNNPIKHTNPTGHIVPCNNNCIPTPWGNIQGWHPLAQGAAGVVPPSLPASL